MCRNKNSCSYASGGKGFWKKARVRIGSRERRRVKQNTKRTRCDHTIKGVDAIVAGSSGNSRSIVGIHCSYCKRTYVRTYTYICSGDGLRARPTGRGRVVAAAGAAVIVVAAADVRNSKKKKKN